MLLCCLLHYLYWFSFTAITNDHSLSGHINELGHSWEVRSLGRFHKAEVKVLAGRALTGWICEDMPSRLIHIVGSTWLLAALVLRAFGPHWLSPRGLSQVPGPPAFLLKLPPLHRRGSQWWISRFSSFTFSAASLLPSSSIFLTPAREGCLLLSVHMIRLCSPRESRMISLSKGL